MLTTAIAYVNAGPHIGHALEFTQADALARYHRKEGKDVFFLTGTDEHGQKIAQVAKESQLTPKALADQNSPLIRQLCDDLGMSYSAFIRTTSPEHQAGAQKLWRRLQEANTLYEKEYEGRYCVGCEAFIQEKDLMEGKCAIHKREPEWVREKNYFFRLSNYSEQIRDLVKKGDLLVYPNSRRNEFLSLCEEGLHDISFSRPKSSLEWGIPVPDDPSQVMYVWCDALSNYITALGYAEDKPEFHKYWPADVHLIGKDILRFHAGVWIGMLLAANLPLPKAIYVHGFVTHEGHKMSKSLGNVVDPFQLLEEWGKDPVRYYLLREIPTTEDGDFSKARFQILYQEELANTIGNLVRRVMSMAVKNFEADRPQGDSSLLVETNALVKSYHAYFESFDLKKALESILELARLGNSYVDQEKPWELAKTNPERLSIVLGNLVDLCETVGDLLEPFLPETAEKILAQMGAGRITLGEALFPNRNGEQKKS